MHPDEIIVRDRQRDAVVDEHFIASVRKRLIQPIVLRTADGEDGPILVAGGRRLQALKIIGTKDLIENVHFRWEHNLSDEEAKVVELEENVKREDLPWRNHVKAVDDLHKIYQKRPGWTVDKTAGELSLAIRQTETILAVARKLDSPLLKDATSIRHAYSILQVAADRAASEVINQITQTGREIFQPDPQPQPSPKDGDSEPQPKDPETDSGLPDPKPNGSDTSPILSAPRPTEIAPPIVCMSFLDWVQTYAGPKFNVIHCDFPYNIDYRSYALSVHNTDEDYDPKGYDTLLTAFCENLDRFCSYSAHILFWFSMDFYEQTRLKLEGAGLMVHKKPFIWLKSDNAGIIPGRDNQYPRHIYETALLCSRGRRPLIRSLSDAYSCPTASNALHPSQKPEPMLKHFLSMLIDDTSDFFDPTCGSGSSLRAADSVGARRIFGLEISSDYAARANAATVAAMKLKRAFV